MITDQTAELLRWGIYSLSIVFLAMMLMQAVAHLVIDELFSGGD
jgi:hypothetical protein